MKINRIVPLLLVIILLVPFLGVTASADVVAQGTCGPNLKWEISDRTLTISGTGAMDDFFGVGNPWYDYMSTFDHVVVKEGVTSIGSAAFSNYPIQSVILSDSVTKIGDKAFFCCMEMTKLVLGKGLKAIGKEAFFTCSSLTAVAFPDSIRNIEDHAFCDCWELQQVAVPDGVTVLTVSVFQNTAIKKIYIPASVTKIEASVSAYDDALTDIYFGGTEEQWNAITIDNSENRNDYLLNATVHFNHQHDWGNNKTVLAATCTQSGSKVSTCSICNGARSASVSKAKHTWDKGSVTAAATCGKEGTQLFTCTVCKETKSETLSKTNEHTWDKGSVTTAATCTKEGAKTFTCTVCKETKTESTPAKETIPVTTAPETTPTVTLPAETVPKTTQSTATAPTQPLPQENNTITIGSTPTEQDPFPAGWITGISLFCVLAAACGIGVWFWQKKKR